MKCGDRIRINSECTCNITARGAAGQRVNVSEKVKGATGRCLIGRCGYVIILDKPIKVGKSLKYEVTLEASSYYINQYVTMLEEYECNIAQGNIYIVNLEGYEYSREYGYLRHIEGKEVVVNQINSNGECYCKLNEDNPEYRWTPTYQISPLFLKQPLNIPLSEYLLA